MCRAMQPTHCRWGGEARRPGYLPTGGLHTQEAEDVGSECLVFCPLAVGGPPVRAKALLLLTQTPLSLPPSRHLLSPGRRLTEAQFLAQPWDWVGANVCRISK